MGLFGPSKREVWKQFAEEIKGNYVQGVFRGRDKVEAYVDNWLVILDTYTVSTGRSSITHTRMRAPFVNLDNFYFMIYRSGVFSEMGKLLGMKDISIGYKEFDDTFVIKSNNEEKIKLLFANEGIRSLMENQPRSNLQIKSNGGRGKKHFPDDVDELYFEVIGVIRDIERLKELYELFAKVLQELCNMGTASVKIPEVDL